MPEDADILSGLYGLRETSLGFTDLATAFAFGLVLAGLIGLAVSSLRAGTRRATWADEIAAVQRLPIAERGLRLAFLLRRITDQAAPGPDRWTHRAEARFGFDRAEIEALGDALYRPEALSPDRLGEMVEHAARTAKN